MSNIIYFKPQTELSSHKNLEDFISTARDKIKLWSTLKVKGNDFNWDSNIFPTHIRNRSIRFHNLKGRKLHYTKNLSDNLTISQPFLDLLSILQFKNYPRKHISPHKAHKKRKKHSKLNKKQSH